MSRKSRQPDGAGQGGKKSTKGTKGTRGRGDDVSTAQRTLVVETQPPGVPFPIVVLLAAVISLPSLANYTAGGLQFDALMVRVLAALAVSWLLSTLVYAVFESMRPPEVTAVLDLPAEEAFESVAAQGALSGTIVEESLPAAEQDPFALDPLEPLPSAKPVAGHEAAHEPGRDESAA